MKSACFILFLAVLLSVLLVQSCSKTDGTPKASKVELQVPQGWPEPLYNFNNNPLTDQGILLGRKLFYDGKLSKDGNFPCASCHQQFAAFATFDHDFSHGINNQFTSRNAQGLFNLAWRKEMMHDGRAKDLDNQPVLPITAPNEMGETIQDVIAKLQADAEYRNLFKAAFGSEEITEQKMMKALSQFMLTMVSANSKYDRVKRGEASFTLAEGLGYDIFKTKCANCHTEPLFTDLSYRNIGMPEHPVLKDKGRMAFTGNKADSLKFMVPSLRNVQLTFPYGHDGRFPAIFNVLDHYRSSVVDGPTTDPLVKNKIPLSNFEIGQLTAFLNALTDSAFIVDQRFAPL